jgi:hypothetical protein
VQLPTWIQVSIQLGYVDIQHTFASWKANLAVVLGKVLIEPECGIAIEDIERLLKALLLIGNEI